MKFVDYAKICVKSGDGGKGCVSFRREKYVPKGGPDGGDGGKGGDVIISATDQMNTLLDFRYKREYKAQRGQDGGGKKQHGRNGADVSIPVPVGTVIKSSETGAIMADFVKEGDVFVAAKGGRGGLGNTHFATPAAQAPRYAQPGEKGSVQWLILELKLLADVGLVGMPNAGKSTFISVVSSARPKIAEYPFTTLSPHLGVVKLGNYKSFIIADIPGLIEGAHQGAGLGHRFLRHIERTRIFLHLVDVSDSAGDNPVESYKTITNELRLYSPEMLLKYHAVVATKTDAMTEESKLDMLEKYCKTNTIDIFKISSATGKGIKRLLDFLGAFLEGTHNEENSS